MRMTILLLTTFLMIGVLPVIRAADEKNRGSELVSRIVATWRERLTKVQTLRCTTKVESFYPKGFVSDNPDNQLAAARMKEDICPKEDTRYRDQSCAWTFDFAAKKVRVERNVVNRHTNSIDGTYKLAPDIFIALAANGKSQLFHPKEADSAEDSQKVFVPDATLYDQAAHPFIISFDCLPLLWSAGAVSADYPDPTQFNRLAGTAAFSYRGEAERKGHKCVITTLAEQNSPTAVREFWVGVDKPHPIYFCRMREGDRVHWQIEVDYRRGAAEDLRLSEWTKTSYGRIQHSSFHTDTYRVAEIDLNRAVPAEVFEKALEPGMRVLDVSKNASLEVLPDGSLAPLSSTSQPVQWKPDLLLWLCISAGALGLLILTWQIRRSRRPNAGQMLATPSGVRPPPKK